MADLHELGLTELQEQRLGRALASLRLEGLVVSDFDAAWVAACMRGDVRLNTVLGRIAKGAL